MCPAIFPPTEVGFLPPVGVRFFPLKFGKIQFKISAAKLTGHYSFSPPLLPQNTILFLQQKASTPLPSLKDNQITSSPKLKNNLLQSNKATQSQNASSISSPILSTSANLLLGHNPTPLGTGPLAPSLLAGQPSILGAPPVTVTYAAGHYSPVPRRSRRRRREQTRRSRRPPQSSPQSTMLEFASPASTWIRRRIPSLPPAIGSPSYLQESSLLIGSIPIDIQPLAARPSPCRRDSLKSAVASSHCLTPPAMIPSPEWPSLQESMVLTLARPSSHRRRMNSGFAPRPRSSQTLPHSASQIAALNSANATPSSPR